MFMRFLLLPLLLLITWPVFAQDKFVSRKQFFLDTSVIEVVLRTDIKKLIRQKSNPTFQPAKLTWQKADSSGDLQETVRIRLRGNEMGSTLYKIAGWGAVCFKRVSYL
jgi:hypothetical protein